MAYRGRGRFRSFAMADMPPISQPPPNFPPLQFKPVPLLSGKKIEYLITLKQEIRSSFKESGYFIPPASVKKDVERYTDKYQPIHAADQIAWDKSLFPRELFEEPKKKKKVKKLVPKKEVIEEKLKILEEKEEKGDPDVEEEEEEEVVGEGEEYEDAEMEEENDYAMSYFDNGENYLDDDDDNAEDGYYE